MGREDEDGQPVPRARQRGGQLSRGDAAREDDRGGPAPARGAGNPRRVSAVRPGPCPLSTCFSPSFRAQADMPSPRPFFSYARLAERRTASPRRRPTCSRRRRPSPRPPRRRWQARPSPSRSPRPRASSRRASSSRRRPSRAASRRPRPHRPLRPSPRCRQRSQRLHHPRRQSSRRRPSRPLRPHPRRQRPRSVRYRSASTSGAGATATTATTATTAHRRQRRRRRLAGRRPRRRGSTRVTNRRAGIGGSLLYRIGLAQNLSASRSAEGG